MLKFHELFLSKLYACFMIKLKNRAACIKKMSTYRQYIDIKLKCTLITKATNSEL